MDAARTWQRQREELGRRVEELRRQSICDTCYDLETGGELYGNEYLVYEDERFKITLEHYPRARGHTIVVYKPHREDLSRLADIEAGLVLPVCVRVVKAIKEALGAEKVYLNTMCDGIMNHLHLQLFPRYAGERIGSTRFVAERRPIADGHDTARRIRAALLPLMDGDDRDASPD